MTNFFSEIRVFICGEKKKGLPRKDTLGGCPGWASARFSKDIIEQDRIFLNYPEVGCSSRTWPQGPRGIFQVLKRFKIEAAGVLWTPFGRPRIANHRMGDAPWCTRKNLVGLGLRSVDRNNKATLLLTILRCTSKSSAKDLSPLINTLLSADKHPKPFRNEHRCQPAMVQRPKALFLSI